MGARSWLGSGWRGRPESRYGRRLLIGVCSQEGDRGAVGPTQCFLPRREEVIAF